MDEDYPAGPEIQITSRWMKQSMRLRIIHSGDWCLRFVLRTASGACHKKEELAIESVSITVILDVPLWLDDLSEVMIGLRKSTRSREQCFMYIVLAAVELIVSGACSPDSVTWFSYPVSWILEFISNSHWSEGTESHPVWSCGEQLVVYMLWWCCCLILKNCTLIAVHWDQRVTRRCRCVGLL